MEAQTLGLYKCYTLIDPVVGKTGDDPVVIYLGMLVVVLG